MISFSALIYIFVAFVSWFYTYRFYHSYLKEKKPHFKYSSLGVFFIGLGCFLYGIFPLFAPNNSFWIEIGFIVGEASVFVGFAALAKAFFHLFFLLGKEIEFLKYAPILILFATAILTLVNILYFASPWVDNYGLIHWNQHSITKAIIFILHTIILIPMGVTFLMMQPKEIRLKIKSVFIAIAFLAAGIGGGMIVSSDTPKMLFISYSLFLIGFLFLFLVVFIPSLKKSQKSDKSNFI